MSPAAVSILFSKKFDDLGRRRGIGFSEGIAHALTRSKASELAAKKVFHQVVEKTGLTEDSSTITKQDSPIGDIAEGTLANEEVRKAPEPAMSREAECRRKLLNASPATLIAEQEKDSTLRYLMPDAKEGVAKQNVKFLKRAGILYKMYASRKGVQYG